MARYARNTTVNEHKSRMEIETTLQRYGASSFMYGSKDGKALIGFEVKDRQIKMTLKMPDRKEFEIDGRGHGRGVRVIDAALTKAIRQRWRALSLVVKAKLEAVDCGIATFEQEFLAYMVLPGGRTVAEELVPKLAAFYSEGKVPRLLAGNSKGEL